MQIGIGLVSTLAACRKSFDVTCVQHKLACAMQGRAAPAPEQRAALQA